MTPDDILKDSPELPAERDPLRQIALELARMNSLAAMRLKIDLRNEERASRAQERGAEMAERIDQLAKELFALFSPEAEAKVERLLGSKPRLLG